MKFLAKSRAEPVLVHPQWPLSQVEVAGQVYEALVRAQLTLAPLDIRLVATRGYEYGGVYFQWGYGLLRLIGASLFVILYPWRMCEVNEIFSCNGHCKNGHHVDVSLELNGHPLKFLPFGVFTPRFMAQRLRVKYARPLEAVFAALTTQGLYIHANPIEALQIHCDYYDVKG